MMTGNLTDLLSPLFVSLTSMDFVAEMCGYRRRQQNYRLNE